MPSATLTSMLASTISANKDPVELVKVASTHSLVVALVLPLSTQ